MTATVNPSWVRGRPHVTRRAATHLHDTGLQPGSRRRQQLHRGLCRSWLDILGVSVAVHARANYDTEGNIAPVGQASREYATNEYQVVLQDSWRLRPNLTITAGVRYGLYVAAL